ncbi:MAG: hypothetical protein RLZZ373_3682 [Pseudomonadota bacterium]
MLDNATFDALVAGFYRAATGEIGWDSALDGVQAAFGARAALLQTVDLGSGRMLGLHSGGPGIGEAVLTYTRDYHAIDPRRLHVMAQGPAKFGQPKNSSYPGAASVGGGVGSPIWPTIR